MGLSETILAAMIGAGATVSAAIFQIFSALKGPKIDVKPKKGSTMRSILAVLALMIASAVGGFLYSELLQQREGDELRAMRMELRELKDLTAAARAPAAAPALLDEEQAATPVAHVLAAGDQDRSAESVAYVPACRRTGNVDATTSCTESEPQRIALCGSIPAYAQIEKIDLFAQPDAVQKPWEEHKAALDQDLGGARFTGKSFEYAQSADVKAVCVNFLQWSSEHSHIARIVVSYGFGADATLPAATDGPMNAVQTTIAADPLPATTIVTSAQR